MGVERETRVRGMEIRFERVHFYLLLSGALAVGFLLGYLASAFFPLVRPSPLGGGSTSSPATARLSPTETTAALKEAHEALDVGELKGAWDKYHQVLMTNPRHVEALTHLGNILMRQNELDEAIRLYDRALGFDPNYSHALFDKGQALKEKGDTKGASEAWNRFLALVPADSDDAKKVKGWIAELKGPGRPAEKRGDSRDK